MVSPAPTPGQLVQWLLEYQGRVAGILERAWTYSHPSYVEKGLPLLYGVMQQHPQLLFGIPGGDAKAQKEFLRSMADRAPAYVAEVQPLVSSLKVISQNFASIAQLLAELHRLLGSLTLRSYPDLLHQYMDTFCGAVRAGLLLEEVPRRAVAQMVALACAHLDKDAAAPLLAAAKDPIFSAPSMAAYLQSLFRACMPRIAQVLELVVGPAMSVADSCEGVASAGLLDMPPPGCQAQQGGGSVGNSGEGFSPSSGGGTGGGGGGGGGGEAESSPAMGMCGMTRRQVHAFLRHRENIRQWGFLGFLVFPEVLRQAGSPQRLSMLLADGFALHLYKDRIACAHTLAAAHLGPALAAVLGSGGAPAGSGGGGGGASSGGGGLGALLGRGMAKLRRSATDDDGSEVAPRLHPLLAAAGVTAAAAAPLQHRMWRAHLIGQLRNMRAACAACPSRVPGQMEMVLAALSLGREELLWFCRHLDREVPPDLTALLASRGLAATTLVAATGNGQGSGAALAFPPEDSLQALQLLDAMDGMHRLLVEHHVALSKQIREAVGADLQAHVVPCTPRVEIRLRQAAAQAAGGSAAAATAAAAGASGLQPFKDLTDLLRSVLLSSAPPPDAAARVSTAAGIWAFVSLQLAAAEDPPLKAAKVLQYAEDTRYLDVLQKSLDAARLLYSGPLLHAAAADLAPGLGHLVEPVLAAATAALAAGRLEGVQAALGAMQGLHWLLPSRAEAYSAATAAAGRDRSISSTNSGGAMPPSRYPSSAGGASISAAASRNSSAGGSAGLLAAGSRPGGGGGAGGSRRLQGGGPQPDDLPYRCMGIVVGCVRQLLAPLVQAPLATAAALTNGGNGYSRAASSAHLLMETQPSGGGGGGEAGGGGLRARVASGSSLIKAMGVGIGGVGVGKAGRLSGGGGDGGGDGGGGGRSVTPERQLRQQESGGGGGGGGEQGGGGGGRWGSGRSLMSGAGPSGLQTQASTSSGMGGVSREDGGGDAAAAAAGMDGSEGGGGVVVLPAATELAARLLPLALALDSGRMLVGDWALDDPIATSPANGLNSSYRNTGASSAGSSGTGSAGSPSGGGGASDAVDVCRGALVEAVRSSFSQLLANTAAAVGQVLAPVPSLQLAPLRRFLEVVAALQPHLRAELSAELARLLVMQAAAPTLQTIGLDGAGTPLRSRASAPLSTNADAATVTPKASALIPVARVGSMASAASSGRLHLGLGGPGSLGGGGPMGRSHSQSGGTAPPGPSMPLPSDRGGGSTGAAGAIGPMTAGLPATSGGGGGGGGVLRAVHAWLWSAVVLDERRTGVSYDAQAGAFTCGSSWAGGEALAAATSVRELSMLFEVFGPCAAADLVRGSSQLIQSCLEQLQAGLDAHAAPLQLLLDAARLPLHARTAAAQQALPRLVSSSSGGSSSSSLATLAEAVQRLGRCMLLRAQLGRAAAAAAERSADFMMLALREMSAPATLNGGSGSSSDGSGRQEWGELLRMAAGGGGGGGGALPERDDPLVTAHLAALLPTIDAAQHWHRLPALLASLLAAPQWGGCHCPASSSSDPTAAAAAAARSSKPRSAAAAAASAAAAAAAVPPPPGAVRAMGVVANAVAVGLSLGLQAAMSQALHPAASQFLLGCDSPAAAGLCAYQRLATAVVQATTAAALASAASNTTSGGGGAGTTDVGSAVVAATAAKQQALAALERLPLLRGYAYAWAEPEDAAAAELTAAAVAAAAAAASADGAAWLQYNDSAADGGPRASLEGALGWWPGASATGGGGSFGAGGGGGGGGTPKHGRQMPQMMMAGGGQMGAGEMAGRLAALQSCEPSLADGRWSGGLDAWRPPARLVPLVLGQVG